MKRSAAITVLAMALGALSACSPDTENSPSPTPTVTSADPTPSPSPSESPTTASPDPTPTPSETLDADQQGARDVVNEFFRLYDELRRNPEMPVQPLADITLNDVQADYLREVQAFRDANALLVGEIAREIIYVDQVETREGEKLVRVEACTDSTDADVIDADSRESILPTDRQPVVHWSVEATTLSATHWYVSALVTDLSGSKCAG
ncbi:hypothetical protein GCM10028820_09920 [Tessaracoccus terricola]